MAIRTSTAQWEGDLKAGKGTMTVGKGAYTGPFSFASRFEESPGTNPEELVAAAHAGCFTMALAAELGKLGVTPESLHTTATVTLDKLDSGWTVTESHLEVAGKVPGATAESFRKACTPVIAGNPDLFLPSLVKMAQATPT